MHTHRGRFGVSENDDTNALWHAEYFALGVTLDITLLTFLPHLPRGRSQKPNSLFYKVGKTIPTPYPRDKALEIVL